MLEESIEIKLQTDNQTTRQLDNNYASLYLVAEGGDKFAKGIFQRSKR